MVSGNIKAQFVLTVPQTISVVLVVSHLDKRVLVETALFAMRDLFHQSRLKTRMEISALLVHTAQSLRRLHKPATLATITST